jgi:beta-fructofuranosidase
MRNSIDENELLRITYQPTKRSFRADDKEITLEPSDPPELHVYLDGSVIEVIVSGRAGYTRRFYYSQRVAPDVTVRIIGGSQIRANAWMIDPISNNRLTTPSVRA